VHATGQVGEKTFTVSGNLLVGADGVRSTVRQYMDDWDGKQGNFVPVQFSSPSAGLRYKVLTLPSDFTLTMPDGSTEFKSETMYSVRGAASSGRQLKMGLIPVQSQYGTRTANVITNPGDKFWDVEDIDTLSRYAENQWPHFPIQELVAKDELTRFAKDRGGTFPKPQHSPSAAWVPNPSSSSQRTIQSGVVILGDALHAFPPDIGQGVNSALEDVMVLRDTLATHGDTNPAVVVKAFEADRMPDVKALVHMVRVSAPFQYSQAPWRSRLWTLGFLSRLAFNRILPSVFEKPSFLLIQRSELPYREVWRRGQQGARRVGLLLGVLGLGVGRFIYGMAWV